MDLDEIKALMASFTTSGLAEMTLTRGEWTLRLVRAADGGVAAVPGPRRAERPRPAAPARPGAEGGVRAPLAGLVYLSPAPGAPPFVAMGTRAAAGDVVAVIEAMKVFNEIRAERDGTVAAIEVASGDEVEAGQLLLRIE
ncbi:biotin/lipoyl-containing protein [Amaricoccus sp.]|uniref:acetyl-CoA carboxylase biotin carboxyl carrier protein n=1 Tax=Amaricoccus sp. TaxID=1872485 RepID=UPI001B7273BC|nr:biotin/lipoyl-containing protein [Amaricoccus sp.]MBP7003040.1 biotin/lipoyl-binding protein [Amaricoccus sp.]